MLRVSKRRRPCALSSIVGLFAVLALSPVASHGEGLTLPSNPAAWLNSPPLTNEMLAGKAAFLWFYEEGCPRCREKWPAMLEAAKKFDGKPVVFIAINSGNTRGDVQQYAREVQLTWPVIVDSDRSFEKSAEVGEISLQNIYQAMVLLPDGTTTDGDFSDIEGTVTSALTDAKWRVDPTDVPEALKPAWVQVEFGNFGAASALIKKNLFSPKPDLKTGAEKLNAAVLKERDAMAGQARAAKDSGDLWKAYQTYASLASRFKGYDLPSDVVEALKTLGADEKVRMELAASKQWETAQRSLAVPGKPSKATLSQLQRIVGQYPGTEAAHSAQEALDRATAAQ